jgi:hypothetical protein
MLAFAFVRLFGLSFGVRLYSESRAGICGRVVVPQAHDHRRASMWPSEAQNISGLLVDASIVANPIAR